MSIAGTPIRRYEAQSPSAAEGEKPHHVDSGRPDCCFDCLRGALGGAGGLEGSFIRLREFLCD